MKIFVILILYGISLGNLFAASCDINLTNSSFDIVLKQNDDKENLQILLDISNGQNCDLFYTFEKGDTGSYIRSAKSPSDEINYSLTSDSKGNNFIMNFSDLNDSNIPSLKNSEKISFWFIVQNMAADEPPDSGDYVDSFRLNIYDGKKVNDAVLLKSFPITIRIHVISKLELSLVETGGSFDPNDTTQTLDFGELETGEELSFDLLIKGNARFDLTLFSQNAGTLKHISSNSAINYDVDINADGQSLGKSSLSTPRTIESANRASPKDKKKIRRFMLKIQIKDVEDKQSGSYSDTVTITAITKG